jgi:allantoate deiminase
MHDVHRYLGEWMGSLHMDVRVDAMGNLRGLHPGSRGGGRRLLIGSHLDTVPNAGAFDGILGVVLGIALVQSLEGERLPFPIEIIGFSEEEGVRFGVPFLGSRALIGRVDDQLLSTTDQNGVSVYEAIRQFGLNPTHIGEACADPGVLAYLEFHIEQGPVLEHLDQPLAVVQAIAGQSRYAVNVTGSASHAGTTPMNLRKDALAGMAEWITVVEADAKQVNGLVSTVAAVHSEPRAGNVVPAQVTASLDVRHAADEVRRAAAKRLLHSGASIAERRGLKFHAEVRLEQATVQMDPDLVGMAQRALQNIGCEGRLLTSGAGHDAMVIAEKVPSVMIFLRNPGGISHHPDESVLRGDVDLALSAVLNVLKQFASQVS